MNLRNLLNQDSDSFNEKLKIAVRSVLGIKFFLLCAILFSGCERKPEFIINGIGYYTKTSCVRDSSWTTYGYRHGLSYRGKFEWSYGPIHEYKCLEYKTDTLKIN